MTGKIEDFLNDNPKTLYLMGALFVLACIVGPLIGAVEAHGWDV